MFPICVTCLPACYTYYLCLLPTLLYIPLDLTFCTKVCSWACCQHIYWLPFPSPDLFLQMSRLLPCKHYRFLAAVSNCLHLQRTTRQKNIYMAILQNVSELSCQHPCGQRCTCGGTFTWFTAPASHISLFMFDLNRTAAARGAR